MDIDEVARSAARSARIEGNGIADVNTALHRVTAHSRGQASTGAPRRSARIGMAIALVAAAAFVGVIAAVARRPDVSEQGTNGPSVLSGILPRYLGTGFTAGWLPDELRAAQIYDGGGAHIGLSAPGTDHEVGLSWAVDAETQSSLLDMAGVRSEREIDLEPNRRARVVETQEQDSQRSQWAVVERLADGTLIKVDTYRLSEKAAIKLATMLSWDSERGFVGDLNIGGGMTATYLPEGYGRLAAWPGPSEAAQPYTIRLLGPATGGEIVVHRGSIDTLAALRPAVSGPLAQRQVDDPDPTLRNIFVVAEKGSQPGVTRAEAQRIVDGLNLSYGWEPNSMRAELTSGVTEAGIPWTVLVGEDNPSTESTLEGSSMTLYECLVVTVGNSEQQICNDDWAGPARRWVLSVGDHQVLLEWVHPTGRQVKRLNLMVGSPLWAPKPASIEPVGEGWAISIAPISADAWPEGTECLNRRTVQSVVADNLGSGGVWRWSCDSAGERDWQVAATRPGRASRYVAV